MRSILRAFGFLSVLPLGRFAQFDTPQIPAMLAVFPITGACLGAALGLIWHFMLLVLDPRVAAALTVCAWEFLTRGLHLDGLADCADGLGGGYDPDARLRIMKDSRVGVFGSAAIFGTFLVKYSALTSLALKPGLEPGSAFDQVLLLALVFAAARFAMLCGMCGARYARPEGGLGRDFIASARLWTLAVGVVIPLVIAIFCGRERGLLALAASVIIAIVLRALFNLALSGQTGDTLGAMVESAEMTALATLAIHL